MPKPWYTIKAAAAGSDTAEVSILDVISSWYGVNARTYLAEFRALKEERVRVFISSPGGDVSEALAIFNGMRATGKHIEVHVLGVAASAASYIAMAGDKIVMPANTMMFLHNPISGVYGNAEDMRESADRLDKFGDVLFSTYAKRWKGEEQALRDVLAAESFLTAAECLEYGLCDEVIDEIAVEARFDVEGLPEKVQALFKKAAPPAPAPAAAVPLAEIVAMTKAAGLDAFVPFFSTDASLLTIEAARVAIDNAKSVKELCDVTGMGDQADAAIRARKPYADVRAQLAQALAKADEGAPVNTAAPTKSLQSREPESLNPGAIWREINAMQRSTK